jgi:hypothetical protein
MTNSERQRRFKAKQIEQGLVQCNLWVPASVVADFQNAADLCRARPGLTVARLVDTSTGRLVGLRKSSSQ